MKKYCVKLISKYILQFRIGFFVGLLVKGLYWRKLFSQNHNSPLKQMKMTPKLDNYFSSQMRSSQFYPDFRKNLALGMIGKKFREYKPIASENFLIITKIT